MDGTNTVSTQTGAAIHVTDGDLTISDDAGDSGTLTAAGGKHGAAIGTGKEENLSGSITVAGGDITALGGRNGAGIGTGNLGNIEGEGSVNITGGTVTAEGGDDGGAGIGTGIYSDMGYHSSINISGGIVTADGGEENHCAGAGIGTGAMANMENNSAITISGDAKVTATGGTNPDDIYHGAGIGTGDSEATLNGIQIETQKRRRNFLTTPTM